MLRSRLACLACGTGFALLVVGCNALLGTDAGERAASPNESPGSTDDGGTTDHQDKDAEAPLGEPPPDKDCGSKIWSAEKMTDATCAKRRTMVIAEGAGVSGLSIERSLSGQVALAYSLGPAVAETSASTSVEILQFTDPKKVSKTSIGGDNDWFGEVKLAKWGDDHFLLAHHCLNREEISVVEIGSAGPVRVAETVASGLPSSTYLSLATNAAGNAHIAWFDPAAKTLSARGKKGSTGAWSARAEIDRDFVIDGLAGSGQVSLVLDDQGTPHVGYHRAVFSVSSLPIYKTASGGKWGAQRWLDEGAEGVGYSIAFGIFGERRFAAYYAPGGQTALPTRSLRFVTLKGVEQQSKELLSEEILVNDVLTPNTSVAMAVDAFGLVHLATAFPAADKIEIRHVRQTRSDGQTTWLYDYVDQVPFAKGDSAPFVSIVVDEKSRPHIAYHVNGVLHYATIYDQ